VTNDAAEAVLSDPSLASEVDTVLRRTDHGYRATSSRGHAEFRRTEEYFEVLSESGHSPLADDSVDQRLAPADEHDGAWDPLGVHATPHAMDSIAQYFDSEHAPDLAVLHAPTHRFHGNAGEHGSLSTTQARAPFIAAGAGVVARGVVDDHVRAVDVAPTLAALLGCTPIDGHDGRGRARSGVHLAVQDGQARTELIDDTELPDHVVVFLLDGTNPNALTASIERGDAPTIGSLVERGTSYRHGSIASLPTATLGNHMTQLTGVHPGHSGVLHNTWYDRAADRIVDLLDFDQMVRARDHLRADIETLHEALHRNEPDARSIVTYEYGDRGADWSTYAEMSSRSEPPPLADEDRRRHRTEEFFADPGYRFKSLVDAQSVNQARWAWSGALGALPRFTWVTLNLTDEAGHSGGPHSEMAMAAIADSDGRVGDVLGSIDAAGALDRTAVVVLADHGMQQTADGEPVDVSAHLSEAGVDHLMVDAQYVYLR
jgi:hypothetical protein